MSDNAIEVVDLSKSFRLYTDRRNSLKERVVRGTGSRFSEFFALRNVDFEVERSTTFGLIGHNGSGKSTLLKVLASIYRPTSGSVIARGRISALLELGAGFHPELTGRENVYLNGAILGLSRRQIADSMEQIVDFAGIGDFIDSPVKVYSSGMYVRLGFSIAVTARPEILIVDEIIAVGDEEFQRKCFDYLFDLRQEGTTIVIVSHSLGLLADLCDQAVWLDHGEVQERGDVREVVDAYLHSVNEKELTSGPDRKDSPDSAHRGSGEIRVIALEYLTEYGQQVPFLTSDDPCVIRMHYKASTDLPEAVFGLSFTHETGPVVSGPNSGYDHPFKVAAGSGFVDFQLDRMPLQPGTYLVSTAIVDRGHVFDFMDKGHKLVMRAETPPTGPGFTSLPGHWSIKEETPGRPSSGENITL